MYRPDYNTPYNPNITGPNMNVNHYMSMDPNPNNANLNSHMRPMGETHPSSMMGTPNITSGPHGISTRKNRLLDILEEQRPTGYIDISDMYIGDEGASLVSNFLRNNLNIRALNLRGTILIK